MTMDEIEKQQVYYTAWKHWGSEQNLDVLIEEMAEFTQAIIKTRRNGVTFSHAFSEEMADVLICLEQLETVMSHYPLTDGTIMFDQVTRIKEQKLERLKERLLNSMAEKYRNPLLDGDER